MNISELIREWIKYARVNGIQVNQYKGREPTTEDVREFLKSEDFTDEQIEPVLKDVDRYANIPKKGEKTKEDFSPAQIKYINGIKKIMRDKSDGHKTQLLRILKHGQ